MGSNLKARQERKDRKTFSFFVVWNLISWDLFQYPFYYYKYDYGWKMIIEMIFSEKSQTFVYNEVMSLNRTEYQKQNLYKKVTKGRDQQSHRCCAEKKWIWFSFYWWFDHIYWQIIENNFLWKFLLLPFCVKMW